jgi:membrane-associated protein
MTRQLSSDFVPQQTGRGGVGSFFDPKQGQDQTMIATIVDWIGPIFSGLTGYLLIAGAVFLDRAAFTGIIMPGELVLALGGIYAGRGDLAPALVIAIGACAGILGECVSYWIGRKYGVRITRHLPLANRFEKHLDQARDFFRRHGGKTIFVGRYVSVVGTFLPFVAGMSNMPFPRFFMFDAAALILWATAVGLLGYLLNSQIDLVDQLLSQFGWGLLILLVVFLGVRFALKRRKRIEKWVSERNPFG